MTIDFKCRKRLYAITLEQDAYYSWKLVHQYMCSRKEPSYVLVCEHDELSEQFVRRLKMKYRAEGHELIEE